MVLHGNWVQLCIWTACGAGKKTLSKMCPPSPFLPFTTKFDHLKNAKCLSVLCCGALSTLKTSCSAQGGKRQLVKLVLSPDKYVVDPKLRIVQLTPR